MKRTATRRRSTLARLAAPAAFLLAAAVAVLLVRSALSEDEATSPTARTAAQQTTSTAARKTPRATPRPRKTTPVKGEFYEIQAGDTLDAVAVRYDPTVEQLLVLNPDIDPVELEIGQRIRVT